MNKKYSFLAVPMLLLLITPSLYARGGHTPPEVAFPIIFIIGFIVIAFIIQDRHLKKTGKTGASFVPTIIVSVVASVVITFAVSFLLLETIGFKLVGGGAILGVGFLYLVYGFIFKKLIGSDFL